MLTLVLSLFGSNRKHIENAISTLKVLNSVTDKIILVHLTENKHQDLENYAKYLFIEQQPNHNFLFQKEALWNYALPYVCTDNICFLDADIYCEDTENWLRAIDNKLLEDDFIIQPFKYSYDTEDVDCNKQSYLSFALDHVNSSYNVTPGQCVAMRTDTIRRFGGFNTLAFTGTSDSLFYYERTVHNKTFPSIISRPWIKNIGNYSKPHDKFAYLNFALIHLNHGKISNRFYYTRDIIVEKTLELSNKTVHDIISFDEHGLLVWKNASLTMEMLSKMYTHQLDDLIKEQSKLEEYIEYISQSYEHKITESKSYKIFPYDTKGVKVNGTSITDNFIEINNVSYVKLENTHQSFTFNGSWIPIPITNQHCIEIVCKTTQNHELKINLVDNQSNVSEYKTSIEISNQWKVIRVPVEKFSNINLDAVSYVKVFSQDLIIKEVSIAIMKQFDFSLITAAWGRSDNTKTFLNALQDQIGNFEIVLVTNNDNTTYSYPNLTHINFNTDNDHLFIKECLYNIGAEYSSSNNLIFCDNDVISSDDKWLQKVADKVKENKIVQVYNNVTDSVETEVKKSSIVAGICFHLADTQKYNPGIGWGMSRTFFNNKLKTFNTSFIFGGGDTAFFEELLPATFKDAYYKKIDSSLELFNFHKRQITMKPYSFDHVDIDLMHLHHGSFHNRKYYERNLIFDVLYRKYSKNIFDYVEYDVNGIWKWKNKDNILYEYIFHKHLIPNGHEAYKHVKSLIQKREASGKFI